MEPRAIRNPGRWLPTLGAVLVLLVAAVIPLPRRRDAPSHLFDRFVPFGPDKLGHLVGHFGLTTVFLWALDEGRPDGRSALAAVLLSSCYGTCTELLQEAIPGRGFERADIVASVLGSLLGVLVATRRSE